MPDTLTRKPNKNSARAIDIVRELTAKHEGELERVVRLNNASSATKLLTDGPITGRQLLQEFKREAKKKDVNVDTFLHDVSDEAAWFTGTKQETTALMQIVQAYDLLVKQGRAKKSG